MSSTTSEQPRKDHWSHAAYTSAASFVPQLTTKVLQYLNPQPIDRILDIGCGDAVLTGTIAPLCAHIVGLDASESFIRSAISDIGTQYPNTEFHVCDCRRVSLDQHEDDSEAIRRVLKPSLGYDKIFSNAAMHWILRDETTRVPFFADVHGLLRDGGTFVFEMGGFENVCEIQVALRAVLRYKYGVSLQKIEEANPWFFPSVEWMRQTLEAVGFEVVVVESEHRPTRTTETSADGSGGLKGWIRLMGAHFLEILDVEEREAAVKELCELLGAVVTKAEDDSQWLNYVRLRGVARRRG